VAEPVPLSSENWWETNPVRYDLLAFLAGRVTDHTVTTAPMLILGQPGSGKSVLARILAARLPASPARPGRGGAGAGRGAASADPGGRDGPRIVLLRPPFPGPARRRRAVRL
jgi:hypothetical protein